MKKTEQTQEKWTHSRHIAIVVAVLNVLLLAGAFYAYTLYSNAYEERLNTENIGNISNMNHSAATNVTNLFESWEIKLSDIIGYMESKKMTHAEALETLYETNSSDVRSFQLIGGDGKGFLAEKQSDGTFPAVNYSTYSYAELQEIFDGAKTGDASKVGFAPEFTDSITALKHFALYKYVTLYDENGMPQRYTLFLSMSSKSVNSVLNEQSDYDGQSSVMIDGKGNYIVSNKEFKSANFFNYLYVYNDLTLDMKNEIIKEIHKNGNGELYYKNGSTVVEDCIFHYDKMKDSDWYCVTCVPLSSFRSPDFDIKFIIYAAALLGAMLIIDLIWLQSMNRRLRVSMRREKEANAAKGSFMSRMSHEIRTPLNAVIGYNTIARNEMSEARTDDARRQAEMKVMDCLQKSDIASKHLLTIINDVLDMSAIENGKITVAHDKFDFRSLISSLTTIFYSQAKSKDISFNVVVGALTDEWYIGDQMRTNQILTNLLSNAIKFTPEGGSVTLFVSQPEAEANPAHLQFEVVDTGIGMTSEYLSHIWTPFEQADSSISRRFGGTGLGLSITKNLVELMGGTIAVTSAPGKGTEFTVDLTFECVEQPQNNAYDFTNVKALVVDDDSNTCDYIKLLFDRCGARCDTVSSGAEAVRAVSAAAENGECYSVCLVDWQMPQMNGVETAKAIREITGDEMPIIVLSAYDYSEVVDAAVKAGVTKFVSKPLFQSSLFDLLALTGGIGFAKPVEKSEKFDFNGARVLLAEDNDMNMEIAKNIMESAGLVVDSAWNGKEAVEQFLESKKGDYLAILMDVHMPEMNGHEATRAIRASSHPEAKTIPIIAMTADAFAENVAEALSSGMNDHISKPIDIDLLFEILRKYMK